MSEDLVMCGAGSESECAGLSGLLSPASTISAGLEAPNRGPEGAHFSPGSVSSDEAPSCFDTPYVPRNSILQYSLDLPNAPEPLSSQRLKPESLQRDALGSSTEHGHGSMVKERADAHHGSSADEPQWRAEDRGSERLYGSGGALVIMEQALMSPFTLSSSENGAQSPSEDGNARSRAMDGDECWTSGERRASVVSNSGSRMDRRDSVQRGSGAHGSSGDAERQWPSDSFPDLDGPIGGQSSRAELSEDSENRRYSRGNAREQRDSDEGAKLLALLGGEAAGPIELDTALLYSPASTSASQRTNADAATPDGKAPASRSAPHKDPQARYKPLCNADGIKCAI